jgi:hypothetical protein
MNKAALVVPFVLVVLAPSLGRWRASVWLKQYRQRERVAAVSAAETLVEPA